MSAIGNAIKSVFHGVEGFAKGMGEVAKGVLTLDFSRIEKGVKDEIGGAVKVAENGYKFTPTGMAASTLMDAATKK